MKKLLVLMAAMGTMSLPADAQHTYAKNGIFNHMDLAVTAGSTGVGVDLSSPLGDYMALRAGFAIMPHFDYNMKFDIQVGDTKESKYDAQGNRVETKFDRMAAMLEDVTGYKVDDRVTMVGTPNFYNFKLLVDVFPFKQNKHWHVTAGCYWGSAEIGRARNTTEDMASLMAVSMYNTIYEKIQNGQPLFSYNGTELSLPDSYARRVLNAGRMGIHVGDWKYNTVVDDGNAAEGFSQPWMPENAVREEAIVYTQGKPYMMEPGADGMVKATMKVNHFKPYLGFGYGGRLIKGDNRYQVSFDCGLMFWGGSPKIVTHDGTDLMNDVENISGKVGDYVDLARKFKAFPVLNVRIARTIF